MNKYRFITNILLIILIFNVMFPVIIDATEENIKDEEKIEEDIEEKDINEVTEESESQDTEDEKVIDESLEVLEPEEAENKVENEAIEESNLQNDKQYIENVESFNTTEEQINYSNSSENEKEFMKIMSEKGTQTIENGEYRIKFSKNTNKTIYEADNKNIEIRSNAQTLQNRFDITYQGDGYYKITSKNTGRCLDVQDGEMKNCTNVRTWTDNGADAQRWIIKEAGDGTYNIISKCNGLYLDVWCEETTDGTNVQMYQNNGAKAQKFIFEKVEHEKGTKTIENGEYRIKFSKNTNKTIYEADNKNIEIRSNEQTLQNRFDIEYQGNGYYKITSKNTGRCLDVQDGEIKNCTNVRTWTDNRADAQRWIIKEAGDGTYNIISKCNDLYLDVWCEETTDGTNVQMFQNNGAKAQKFIFEKVEHEKGTQTIENGEYRIKFSKNTNKTIYEADNKNIEIRSNEQTLQNRFDIEYQGDGYYKITSKNTGRCLDVQDGGMKNCTNVRTWTDNGADAQKWIIKAAGDGTYNIISKCNDLYLDVWCEETTDGTNVQMFQNNGAKAQKFIFEKVEHEKGTKTIENGEYRIKFSRNTNKTIYEADNQNIEIRSNEQTLQNRFDIEYQGEGYYKIKSKKTYGCLDVQDAGKENGTNVRTWEDNGADAQRWIIKEVGDGTYNIISKCNDLYLDVWCEMTTDGTNIQMQPNNGAKAQRFIFEKVEHEKGTKTIEDGLYKIKVSNDSNKVISISNNNNAVISKDKNQNSQAFIINYLKDGYYKITSKKTGGCLDVQDAGMKNGTNVRTWENNGADAQKWIIKEVGDGRYNIISKCNDLYIDVWNGITTDGTNLQMYEGSEAKVQEFMFEEATPNVIDDGLYEIGSLANPNMILDVEGASLNSGANIQLWQRLDENHQKFSIEYCKDGYYTIQSLKSEKMLDVKDAGKENGTNVRVWEDNGADAQKWKIIYNEEKGTYKLISKCNGLYLTALNGGASNGTNICTYEENAGEIQEFFIKETEPRVYNGIDVSQYQSQINWSEVKKSGIQFAIIRCGYGKNDSSQDDKYFSYNVKECERLGIPYGIYLYSYAGDVEGGRSEAEHALRLIRENSANPTLGVWIDIEDADGYKKRNDITYESGVQVANEFCTILMNNGYKAGIYASLSWLNSYLNNNILFKYDKWVAQWNSTCDYKNKYIMWQYTSRGTVNGILGNVDMDRYYR